MAFWVHVEKGYTIFIVYLSGFKSLESLARLLKKVLKSCETFKIQDFANANYTLTRHEYLMSFYLKVRLLVLLLSYGVHWESPGQHLARKMLAC